MPKHRRPSHSKPSPPFFSKEFLLQNHADIISVVCIIVLLGLMFQPTNAYANIFVSPHYRENATNITVNPELLKINPELDKQTFVYGKGWKDVYTIMFYTCVCVVLHAVVQEYVWERISRKYHLSNTCSAKFYETGILTVFYILSAMWGVLTIMEENITSSPSLLWTGYYEEHFRMPFITKFYFLIQIAYWVHCYPELYFLRVPSTFIPPRLKLYTITLVFICISYYLSLQRFAICLLTLEATSEVFACLGKLAHYLNHDEKALFIFSRIWTPIFCVVRIVSVLLSVIVLYHGFGSQGIDLTIRLATLLPTVLLQFAMSYTAFRAWRNATGEVKKVKSH